MQEQDDFNNEEQSPKSNKTSTETPKSQIHRGFARKIDVSPTPRGKSSVCYNIMRPSDPQGSTVLEIVGDFSSLPKATASKDIAKSANKDIEIHRDNYERL